MPKNRDAIISLYEAGKRQSEIVRMLRVPQQTVSYAIKRLKKLGHKGDRPGRRRKRTINIRQNLHIIQQRIQRNPRSSMRKVARETGISRESVRRMAKKELKLKPYKFQKVQLLTDENKRVPLQRCRALLRRSGAQRWKNFVFTDEKVFTMEQFHNPQNDRNWSEEASGPSAIVAHCQNSQYVMVWGGICATGKTPLVFVEKGVKINQQVYQRDILEAVVLPWAQRHFGN